MGHNHNHNHAHGHEGSSNIKIAFLLNFGFAIAEIIGGFLTGSTAILSDAVHDFGDSLALALSFIFEKFGKKPANNKYTYGFKRLSVIGAIINIVVLSVGTIFVFTEAIDNIMSPKSVVAEGMFIMSIFGIVINGFSVFRMSGSKKILDKTVMMHLLEDLFGWIAVFIVSIAIYFTNWYILDPILSLMICIIIGRNIYMNTKNVINIIMQGVPDQELYEAIEENLEDIEGVLSVENLNIWTLDGDEHVLTAKLKVDNNSSDKVFMKVKKLLSKEGIENSTIELIS